MCRGRTVAKGLAYRIHTVRQNEDLSRDRCCPNRLLVHTCCDHNKATRPFPAATNAATASESETLVVTRLCYRQLAVMGLPHHRHPPGRQSCHASRCQAKLLLQPSHTYLPHGCSQPQHAATQRCAPPTQTPPASLGASAHPGKLQVVLHERDAVT
jgi:hypothetical protein